MPNGRCRRTRRIGDFPGNVVKSWLGSGGLHGGGEPLAQCGLDEALGLAVRLPWQLQARLHDLALCQRSDTRDQTLLSS